MQKKKVKLRALEKKYSTVIFLDYIYHVKPDNLNFLPVYFADELKIKDHQALIRKMLRKKMVTKENGYFELTKVGASYVRINKDYVKLFHLASPYINLSKFEEMRKRDRSKLQSFEKTIISLLYKKLAYYIKRENSNHVINIAITIGDMYVKLGNIEKALEYYIVALYYQVAGTEYYENLKKLESGKTSVKAMKKEYKSIFIPYDLQNKIVAYKDVDYVPMVNLIYDNRLTHIRLLSKNDFMTLIRNIMEENYNSKSMNNMIKNSYMELIDKISK